MDFILNNVRKITLGFVILACVTASMYLCACSSNQPTNSNSASSNPQISDNSINANKPTENSSTVVSSSSASVNGKIHHVAAYNETFSGDALWCIPMQLCWNNAMKMTGAPFVGTSPSVDALNQQSTTEKDIGEDHYYAYSGIIADPSSVYEEITTALKEKFDETSEIISQAFLEENKDKAILYAMLFREFQYAQPFDIVNDGNGYFGSASKGNVASNVSYFGIASDRKEDSAFYEAMNKQVEVLYYDDNENFAVLLKSKDGDNVVVVKSPQGTTAQEMFENVMNKAKAYTGSRALKAGELLSIPNVDLKAEDEYGDLRGAYSNGFVIEQALQITELRMDNEGGRVKSEAVIVMKNSVPAGSSEKLRDFIFDDTYAMFLVDGNIYPSDDYDNMTPYLALSVENIENVQPGVAK